jgi:hypothetical protein
MLPAPVGLALLSSVLLLGAVDALALTKCVDAAGAVTYQEGLCRAGTKPERVRSDSAVTEALIERASEAGKAPSAQAPVAKGMAPAPAPVLPHDSAATAAPESEGYIPMGRARGLMFRETEIRTIEPGKR